MTCRVCFLGRTHASIVWIFLPIRPTRCYMRNCSSLWKRPALLAWNEDFTRFILVTCVHCMLLFASVFLVSWVRSGQHCMHEPPAQVDGASRVCTDEAVYAIEKEKPSICFNSQGLDLRWSLSVGT